MKHARKLTSLLLALVMVFALAVTVAAEGTTGTTGTGRITVDNPREDQEYKAYKIFDVVYDTTKKHYSYTIDSSNLWLSTVQNYNGLKLTQVNGTSTYIVEKLDSFSAPTFAETLKAALNAGTTSFTGTKLEKSGNPVKASATVDELGYYFVTSTSGALCNLTTTDPEVIIHDKTDVPFEKTGIEKRDVEVGNVLPYKITGKVPDTTGFDEYTYVITDTMSEGLTFNESSVQVKVGNALQAESPDTYAFERGSATDNYTFKVTIYVKKYTPGQSIEVDYTATVNEKAVAQVSENKAVLIYSNKPGTDGTGKREAEPHKVYSAQIEINKYWTDNGQKKALANVGFKLYKKENAGGQESIKFYKYDDAAKKVDWVEEAQAPEVMTTADGKAYFKGLANGDYWLVETTTPAGYNPLEKPVDVKVEGNADSQTSLTVTKEIENKTGAVLPSTGGMGTTVFYVLGFVLVVGAGVLLVTKKRMSQGEV